MAGTTGPVTLPGTLALITAEILAGIALAQTINPGTPCVFGGNSSSTDMRTGAMALGGPEAIIMIKAARSCEQWLLVADWAWVALYFETYNKTVRGDQ